MPDDFDFSRDYHYAALILFPIALFGLISNLAVVAFLRVVPSLNNPFGSLTLSQAVADCGHQFIFAFYYAPCLFARDYGFYSWSEQVGFVLMIFYEINLLSHVFISTNRFCAVYTPLTYNKLFSTRNTNVLIGTYWIFSIASIVYKFKTGNCAFYLPQGQWIFTYGNSEFCQNVRTFDFIKFIIYVVIIGVFDVITIAKVNYLRARHVSLSQSTVSSVRSSQTLVAPVRKNRQMNLIYQAALQGTGIFLELITYYLLQGVARNKWELLLMTSGVWCAAHAMDGFIVIVCNREFRRYAKKIILCRWIS